MGNLAQFTKKLYSYDFNNVLNKDYSQDEYEKQFSVKIQSNLEKIERIREIYSTKVSDTPSVLFDTLNVVSMQGVGKNTIIALI